MLAYAHSLTHNYTLTCAYSPTSTLSSGRGSVDISGGTKGSQIPEQSPIDLSCPGMLAVPGTDIIPPLALRGTLWPPGLLAVIFRLQTLHPSIPLVYSGKQVSRRAFHFIEHAVHICARGRIKNEVWEEIKGIWSTSGPSFLLGRGCQRSRMVCSRPNSQLQIYSLSNRFLFLLLRGSQRSCPQEPFAF